MSNPSRTIPTAARSGRYAVPNLPAWTIAALTRAEADHLAPQPLQLGLPAYRPWLDEPIEGERDGILTLDL